MKCVPKSVARPLLALFLSYARLSDCIIKLYTIMYTRFVLYCEWVGGWTTTSRRASIELDLFSKIFRSSTHSYPYYHLAVCSAALVVQVSENSRQMNIPIRVTQSPSSPELN